MTRLPWVMPSRRFPKPWTVEPMPSGYWVIDAKGVVLAHVYGQPVGAIAVSGTRPTHDEARRISKLISRLPEQVELEKDRNKARSRRKPQPLRFKPVTIGDLVRDGKLLEVGLWRTPAGASSLYRRWQSRAANADAGAGGGEPSRLLEVIDLFIARQHTVASFRQGPAIHGFRAR